jgi:hypothetical protein
MDFKKLIRLLLVFSVIAIYSIVIYKWLGLGNSETVVSNYTNDSLIMPINNGGFKNKDFTITDKNPFDLKQEKKSNNNTKLNNNITRKTLQPNKIKTAAISFHGSVKNSSGKKFYLKIDRELKAFSLGQTIDGVKLISVKDREAKILNNNLVEIISIGVSLPI